jgi:transketolase
MIEAAMIAAEQLENKGISCKVVNASTMKPFDYEGVIALASEVKAIVTAEDHSYIGGLAAHVAFALRQSSTKMDYVAIEDEFGQSAHSANELMEHYNLTSDAIINKILSMNN